MIQKIKGAIKAPWKIFYYVGKTKYGWIVPDKLFIQSMYRYFTGEKLNLLNPQGFNEKLQWLKLYDRNPLYTTIVDKYEGKKWASSIIGERHIIPTLGVWERFEDIDFDLLPNRFVLKCTHDSAGVVIVDKNSFDYEKIKIKITSCLSKNFYYSGREWPYKNVKPRIIAETYMEDRTYDTNGELIDYKFYCFGGKPKFLYVAVANFIDGEKHDKLMYLDLDWKAPLFSRPDHEQLSISISKPEKFDEMVRLAYMLAKDIPFVRVDLYYINGEIYFSELTFFPGSGVGLFTPRSYELEIGGWIELPIQKK